MYAVLDIEATNGKVGTEKIIEIAIYRFNGQEITDQFISLVNPDAPVDAMVQKLTGITNKMVRTAPKFYELAKRVLEITENCTLVGHNVGFDVRMLKQEFNRLGFYDFNPQQIDTLPLSQKIFPEEDSHSLGKLTKSLGIPLTKRHRASGDAMATLELFKILKEKDNFKEILQQRTQRKSSKKSINKFLNLIESIPNETGVFYLLDSKNQIFFIDFALNVKQKVTQLLTGRKKFHYHLQKTVKKVEFELTGSSLIANIKYINEVGKLKPKFNKFKRKRKEYYGIFFNESVESYHNFSIKKLESKRDKPLFYFESEMEAEEFLFKFSKENELCLWVNHLGINNNGCFLYDLNQCKGACNGKESVQNYNSRADAVAKIARNRTKYFLLIDKGNLGYKHSFIFVENEKVKAYGFHDYDYQITTEEKRNNRLIPIQETAEIRFMVMAQKLKVASKNIIELAPN